MRNLLGEGYLECCGAAETGSEIMVSVPAAELGIRSWEESAQWGRPLEEGQKPFSSGCEKQGSSACLEVRNRGYGYMVRPTKRVWQDGMDQAQGACGGVKSLHMV